jgi:hypothetical protein
MIEKYEVINRPLTVGSYSMSVGSFFTREMWPYGDDALEEAIKKERCKLKEEKKEPVKKESEKSEQEKPEPEPEKNERQGAKKKEKSE